MKNVDWSLVSAIISAVTALAAIIAPVVSAIYTVKSQARTKRMESYSARVYDALAELSRTYGALSRHSAYYDDDTEKQRQMYNLAVASAADFRAACYKVLSLVPGPVVQDKINHLLRHIGTNYFSPRRDDDRIYCELMDDINEYLLTLKVKKKKQNKISLLTKW